MRLILTALIWIFGGVIWAQNQMIPQLTVEKGSIELVNQALEVNVVDHVADVRIYQTFKLQNSHQASYLFPAGTSVSLYELLVFLPDKVYSLDARNMDNIRKQVVAENKKGKKIELLHSENPYFIQLKIPDVPEGTEIKVTVKYLQNLDKEKHTKILTLPSLVTEQYKKLPDETAFQIGVISPTKIYEAQVASHDLVPQKISDKYLIFEYYGSEVNKAIELEFNTRGDEADAGMVVYEDGGCRYILGVVEPPKNIQTDQIAPREYIFVMDVSGSMHGFPLETSKELINRILNDLKPEEKFNVLFFAGSSDFFSEKSVYATPENKDLAIQSINRKRGKGNTKMSEALRKVYNYKPDPEYNRIVVMVTDGLLGDDRSLIYELKQNLNDAQYFTFGIGYDVDRRTVQQLAGAAGTEAVLITEQDDASSELDRFFNLIKTPLLRHIEVQSKQLNLRETYPNQFNGFLSSQATSFVSKECSGARDPKLILTGINGNEKYHREFGLTTDSNNRILSSIQYIWAREKIDFLLQEEERCGQPCIKSGKYRNEIIKIGEELNLATPYTSFIEESYINFNDKKGRKYSLYANPNNSLTFQNDFDSDFDGVPNTLDECPYDKGKPERKGCPRTKEEKIAQEINRQLEGIEFDFDSYVIKTEFYEKLDTAAEIIMANNPEKYVVEGHTDAAGTYEYNQVLSVNRAKAVVRYLKNKGVDFKQLKIVGKGDTELKHPECRPQEICDDQKNFENRRVIFKLMK